MFCQRCGKTIPDDSQYCGACGHRQGTAVIAGGGGHEVPQAIPATADRRLPFPPPTHQGLALFCTLLCCLPCGIVALVYADKVNSRYLTGDHAGALQASESAKTWAWAGIVGGIIIIFLAIVSVLAGLQ